LKALLALLVACATLSGCSEEGATVAVVADEDVCWTGSVEEHDGDGRSVWSDLHGCGSHVEGVRLFESASFTKKRGLGPLCVELRNGRHLEEISCTTPEQPKAGVN
jgi:hypothetical protein